MAIKSENHPTMTANLEICLPGYHIEVQMLGIAEALGITIAQGSIEDYKACTESKTMGGEEWFDE